MQQQCSSAICLSPYYQIFKFCLRSICMEMCTIVRRNASVLFSSVCSYSSECSSSWIIVFWIEDTHSHNNIYKSIKHIPSMTSFLFIVLRGSPRLEIIRDQLTDWTWLRNQFRNHFRNRFRNRCLYTLDSVPLHSAPPTPIME